MFTSHNKYTDFCYTNKSKKQKKKKKTLKNHVFVKRNYL